MNATVTVTHTPGPWTCEQLSDDDCRKVELDEADRFWICGGLVDEVLATVHAPVHGHCEEANARLITAAPELLDACALFSDAAHDAVAALNGAGLACPSSIAFAAEQARHALARATERA